jgi:holo-[acyl-carrier protein] synthase
MNVASIGVDICEINRLQRIIIKHQNRFLAKVYTPTEIAYCNKKIDKFSSFAARFAAKEAVFKALGTGLRMGINWKDIEVNNDSLGRPYLKFYGKTNEMIADRKAFLSLSHTDQNAIAFVIIEGKPFVF